MMQWILSQWAELMQNPVQSGLVFLTIMVLESLLSVDNAAVLATVVNKSGLNDQDQNKALKYGIIGAFVFRGLGLFIAGWLIANPAIGGILKIAGGLYLCHLWYTSLTPEKDSTEEGDFSWLNTLLKTVGISGMSVLMLTIIQVEVLDIVFSVDNIFACVAMSKNMLLIIIAVICAIISMRFITQKFVVLMEKYPSLEGSAYVVILLLGLKLVLGGLSDVIPSLHWLKEILENHYTDFVFSGLTMLIFFYPIVKSKLKISGDNA
jgi:YkoY family integral membrane protein